MIVPKSNAYVNCQTNLFGYRLGIPSGSEKKKLSIQKVLATSKVSILFQRIRLWINSMCNALNLFLSMLQLKIEKSHSSFSLILQIWVHLCAWRVRTSLLAPCWHLLAESISNLIFHPPLTQTYIMHCGPEFDHAVDYFRRNLDRLWHELTHCHCHCLDHMWHDVKHCHHHCL